jgi:general L-amino acid transport system substrate-binding protein
MGNVARWAAAAAAGACLLAGAAEADTLKTVRDRGTLICGVNEGLIGFAAKDDKGVWTGFDADFCRAVAAAVFGDASKVQFEPYSAADRFKALSDKKIDLLSRNSSWTLGRENDSSVLFTGVDYYDGQAFMVAKSRKLQSALELDGSKVCVGAGTTSEANVADYFKANHMALETVKVSSADEEIAAYNEGKCDVITSDASQLYALRLKLTKPSDNVILPDVISKEPLSPVVRQDDVQWAQIVRWVNFAMIDAEELGVSSKTLDEALKSEKPEVRRLLGIDGDYGTPLGLSKDFVVKIVGAVGNYSENYERNIGVKSQLGIPRGLNDLWSNGGILYAPPIR